jgi:(5-formylfuran-3-yl)methyl phosphate synthase
MRVLVSVRSVAEAQVAAQGGADFIDLKEPHAGALGALPDATQRDIVNSLRQTGCTLPISATIGDLPMHALSAIVQQVHAVAATGVHYVKVGITREPGAVAVLLALSKLQASVVPVFIADQGVDFDLITQALLQAHGRAAHFPALMLDTAEKAGGCLLDKVPTTDLRRFVAQTRAGGALVGLAGALRVQHVPGVLALAPDFVGFRSAVCVGHRAAALDAGLLRDLVQHVRAESMQAG